MTPRRALVIAHEPSGPGGQVAVRLEQRGYEVTTHVVTPDHDEPNRATPFPELDHYDLVAIMGSIRSLTDTDSISTWVHDELDRIATAHRHGIPMLGVCFGGQLLAQALGGSVETAPVTEIGWYDIQPAEGATNPVGPGPWMEWHHDRFHPPPDATVLARSEHATQLFTIGRSAGTQFHPEVDIAHVDRWLAQASDEYLADNGVDPDEIRASVQHHETRNIEQCHALVDWFLDDVANLSHARADRETP